MCAEPKWTGNVGASAIFVCAPILACLISTQDRPETHVLREEIVIISTGPLLYAVYLSVCLSVCLSHSLALSLSVSVCLSLSVSVSLSVSLSLSVSVSLSLKI